MIDDPLFPGFGPPTVAGVSLAEHEELSYGRRLTLRQREYIKVGIHPLTRGRLHPDAADGVSGPTCGGCVFREERHHGNGRYPKCLFGDGIRVTRGAASDVRAWWPACPDHEARPDA